MWKTGIPAIVISNPGIVYKGLYSDRHITMYVAKIMNVIGKKLFILNFLFFSGNFFLYTKIPVVTRI